LEPEKLIEEITNVEEDWKEKVSELVAELSGQSLKDIVNKLIEGLEDDEKLLLAAMRLASMPIVASSHPELVFKIVDVIKDLKDANEEILEVIPYFLESAVKSIPPEDPGSIRIAETILVWCPREPKLCRLLEHYAGLIDTNQLIKTLVKVLETDVEGEDFEVIVGMLKSLIEELGKLDPEARQKLLKIIINKIKDNIKNFKDLIIIAKKLGDKREIILEIATMLAAKLASEKTLSFDSLSQAISVENELIELLHEDPEQEDIIKALRALYEAKLLAFKKGNIPCRIEIELSRIDSPRQVKVPVEPENLIFKPIIDLKFWDNWEVASRATRIFLEIYLGKDKYKKLVNKISKLNKVLVYHPWVVGAEDLEMVFKEIKREIGEIIYNCKYIGRGYYGFYNYKSKIITFDNDKLVLILVALGFNKLEAFSGILAGMELPKGLKTKAEKRLQELLDLCRLVNRCNVPDVLPVMVKLGLVGDKLVKGIASSLTLRSSITPIVGGVLASLDISASEPIKVAKVVIHDRSGCKPVWEGRLNNGYSVYLVASEDPELPGRIEYCLQADEVCLKYHESGEICLKGNIIKSNK